MNVRKSLSWIAFLAITIVAVACNENTTEPTNPPEAPNAPTGLAATSIDDSTVGVKWTAPAAGVTPTGYEITYKAEGTSTTYTANVSGSTTQADVTELAEGTVYEFTVRAMNDTAKSGPTATIKWSPASRHTASIILYERNSSNGSGVMLPETAGLTVDAGSSWDICFDVKYGSGGARDTFHIGSPGASSYTDSEGKFNANGQVSRITEIGLAWRNVTGLGDIYETVDLGSSATLAETMLDFSDDNSTGRQFAFVAKTEDNHFAKILVKKNPATNELVWGAAPNRYISLEVSYQSMPNIPYAKVERPKSGPIGKTIRSVSASH